ncbi:MAG: LamG domain-containing protein [Planctomycetes bacterium]|nr:LamG domain-containing protein [Planctomycetota bacterium]
MRAWLGLVVLGFAAAIGAEAGSWWGPQWRLRTTVVRPAPYRDGVPRPVEVAVDFPLLLKQAYVSGEFDPASVRVVERGAEAPFALRSEVDPADGRERRYLAWVTRPKAGEVGAADIYFDARERGIKAQEPDPKLLPPENLLANGGFEDEAAGWQVASPALVRFGRFKHTTGGRSLKAVVDEATPKDASREVSVSQKIDVRAFTAQEMVLECDLVAERAAYGAPVSIELEQHRGDGSRIPEYAVDPRWLTIELAAGQLVQFRERGRFSPEAASVTVRVRFRCTVRDADTGEAVTGPESFFTVWLDRVVVRPGERWPWPAASNGGFVAGALERAPLNRGFEFTGQRRLAFNGASEGTLTSGAFNPDPRSVHWGLEAGTLEFWCRPSWNADDGAERVFFEGIAYGHRLQSRLRKLGAEGRNRLEFTIADAGGTARTLRGPAPLRTGQWHHLAATWDFPKAHLQLFVDGKRVAAQGPGKEPWPSSLTPKGKTKGIGIAEDDSRSLPMQAFLGGDKECHRGGAEAVLDEFRVSDIPRYNADFAPPREESAPDEHTRALFRFENERDGTHGGDDRFVRGHLVCGLEPQEEKAPLEILKDGRIERREVPVRPHARRELFEANRAETRLVVTRPVRALPDPRLIERRERWVERTVAGANDGFVLKVEGDFEPLMRSVTFEHAKGAPAKTLLIPHWRANDNVVPFSAESLAVTLAPNAASEAERAFEAFKYALATTNYFDAPYCETLPDHSPARGARHRPRVSYTLLKALNIYPFDQCGPMNHMLRKLFLSVGISSNDAPGTHHQFEQAFYGGSWRLFDLSPRLYWLDRDNATVASRRAVEEDPYLKIRQGGNVCAWLRGRRGRATFGTAERPHRMDFLLRPGERASFCWHNEGRWFELTGNREPLPLAKLPPCFGNGAILYEPVAEGEAAVLDNMAIEAPPNALPTLRAREPAKEANLTYRVSCPYILSDLRVSGAYGAPEPGAIRLSLSFDEGKTWSEVWRNPRENGLIDAELREQVSARYAYWLKIAFAAGRDARIAITRVRTTFVASPLALPGKLRLGENRVSFVGGPPAAPVRTVCRWVERHKTDLGASLNALSFYLNGDETHRNLYVAAPGAKLPIAVTVTGRRFRGEAWLVGPFFGHSSAPAKMPLEVADPSKPGRADFVVSAPSVKEGGILPIEVGLREDGRERILHAQLLVAEAPLVREAERSDAVEGGIAVAALAEASGAATIAFAAPGKLAFDFAALREGKHALWLRARWEPRASTRLSLTLDDGPPRELRAAALIGFSDWTDPGRAHTKMFAHFGEQHGHWAWYRIPDVQLTAGKHRLALGAEAGAALDALLLLPQNDAMDRAAMSLFQNWNFAPWQNPH